MSKLRQSELTEVCEHFNIEEAVNEITRRVNAVDNPADIISYVSAHMDTLFSEQKLKRYYAVFFDGDTMKPELKGSLITWKNRLVESVLRHNTPSLAGIKFVANYNNINTVQKYIIRAVNAAENISIGDFTAILAHLDTIYDDAKLRRDYADHFDGGEREEAFLAAVDAERTAVVSCVTKKMLQQEPCLAAIPLILRHNNINTVQKYIIRAVNAAENISIGDFTAILGHLDIIYDDAKLRRDYADHFDGGEREEVFLAAVDAERTAILSYVTEKILQQKPNLITLKSISRLMKNNQRAFRKVIVPIIERSEHPYNLILLVNSYIQQVFEKAANDPDYKEPNNRPKTQHAHSKKHRFKTKKQRATEKSDRLQNNAKQLLPLHHFLVGKMLMINPYTDPEIVRLLLNSLSLPETKSEKTLKNERYNILLDQQKKPAPLLALHFPTGDVTVGTDLSITSNNERADMAILIEQGDIAKVIEAVNAHPERVKMTRFVCTHIDKMTQAGTPPFNSDDMDTLEEFVAGVFRPETSQLSWVKRFLDSSPKEPWFELGLPDRKQLSELPGAISQLVTHAGAPVAVALFSMYLQSCADSVTAGMQR